MAYVDYTAYIVAYASDIGYISHTHILARQYTAHTLDTHSDSGGLQIADCGTRKVCVKSILVSLRFPVRFSAGRFSILRFSIHRFSILDSPIRVSHELATLPVTNAVDD